MPLFESVSYHLSQSLVERTRLEISRMLDGNAAKDVPIDLATHIISDTIEFEGCDTLQKRAFCVTPYWVERSMELGHLQDPKYFSADKEMFFSGIVATSADLPPGDKEVIASGIMAQGGAWREGLTRDVTHLFVTNTRSEKYRTAIHFRNSAHITIVLPQWFDQCWSTQMRLPSDVFQFPDPPYLRKDHDVAAYKAQMLVKAHAEGSQHLFNGLDKKAMYGTMQVPVTSSSPAPRVRNVWQGRSILLSPLLELDAQRRESVEARIRLAGGVVVSAHKEDESTAIDQADILITRFRTGAAYARALASGKTIGTLAWLFYVERTGIMSRPRDQLLHYPVRDKPIQGFKDHEITVTNYQGDAREYLKKLIEVMGAKFTPTMSGRNTVVIAAYKSGNKTAKAEEWSVPVVTHKWLEDCFVEWRNLTPAQKRYLDYAPGVNYGTVLGDRGVGRVGLEEETESLPQNKQEPARPKDQSGHPKPGEGKKPDSIHINDEGLGTATCVRDALEVEEVEDVLHIAGDPHESHSGTRQGPSLSPTKLGPPHGVKKSPSKKGPSNKVPSEKPKSQSSLDANNADSLPLKKTQGPADNGSNAKLPQTDTSTDPAPVQEKTPMKVGPPKKSRPKPTPSTKPMVQPDNDVESITEIPPPEPHAKASRGKQSSVMGTVPTAKSKSAPKVQKPHAASSLRSDQESADELVPRSPKGKSRTVYAVDTDEKSDQDVFMSHTKLPKSKSRSKPTVYKSRSRHPMIQEADGNRSSTDETSRKTGSKIDRKKRTSKVKEKRISSTSESDDNKIKLLAPKKVSRPGDSVHKGNREDVLQPSPNRVVSVNLPDPRSLLASRRRGSSPDSTFSLPKSAPRLAKAHDRMSSARVITPVPFPSSPKRGRPFVVHDSVSRSPTPPLRRSPRRPRSGNTPAPRDVATFRSNTPPLVQRASHRHAAVTATQRLRNEVMPDVINFENERRRSTKGKPGRKRKSAQFAVSDDEDEEQTDDSRDRKRRKVTKVDHNKGKGKGKALVRADGEDSDGPPIRFVTNTKAKKRLADDDEKPGPSKRSGQGEARKKIRRDKSVSDHGSEDEETPGRSSYDPRKIRILTTKVVVTEQIEKAMIKLGVRFTQKPHECTHLVTNHLSRTEKFLCALPNVPFVLSMDWLVACAESGSVVAESDYPLRDPDMEHKHKFKLVEALERAKELKKEKQKLLQGHFFYVTPGVPSDFNVLKSVLRALGAECKESVPTIRNLSKTRHVISSLKDESLWRPLVKHGVTIYSHELILGAGFTQFVEWDGEDKILAREG